MAVALADSVTHPGTEMVEGLDAAVPCGAVFRTQGPHNLAAHAQLAPVARPQCG